MDTMQLNQLSKEKQRVVADAEKAGFTVSHRIGCIDVFRMSKHAKPRLLSGVRIFVDGMALDMRVDLSVAKVIRSAKGLRSVLSID